MKLYKEEQAEPKKSTGGERRAYPGKPENEQPLYSSNAFSRCNFTHYACAIILSMLFSLYSFATWWDFLRQNILDLPFTVTVLIGVGCIVVYAILAVRELTFLHRNRPNFLEIYKGRIVGRAKNISGPGPKRQYFSCSFRQVVIRPYRRDRLTLYTDDHIFVCYTGEYKKEITQYLAKRIGKSVRLLKY